MSKTKKVIIWNKNIDSLISEKGKVGGITVQMYFWARIFSKNGWKVYSFSETQNSVIQDIHFIKFTTKRYIGIFIEFVYSLFILIRLKPDLILFRGATRNLSYLSIHAKLLNIKLVFFGASDVNFQPEKEYISRKHDRLLYRFGVRKTHFFVVQNILQQQSLLKNYNKKSIIIPNIWINTNTHTHTHTHTHTELSNKEYVLWVSNFRELKRPEWFIELAKRNPDRKFVMVGGEIEKQTYEKCRQESKCIKNLDFKGELSFHQVNELFASAMVLVCTSEFEGFPNSFLQAWAYKKPIITTVDPSDIISKNKLGFLINSISELDSSLNALENKELYHKIQINIDAYFNSNHNPQQAYELLIQYTT